MTSIAATQPVEGSSRYPVHLQVDYPTSLSRWKIFFKWLFVIPNAFVLGFVGIAFWVISFFSWWAVLFTGKYPKGFFDFVESYQRWVVNLSVYASLLRDEYPPFSGAAGRYPAVHFSVDYPDRLNQIMVIFRVFTVIPAAIVYFFVGIAAAFVQFVGWFAILFSGNMPRGLFDFVVGSIRWNQRIFSYYFFMTDAYPPFGMAE